MMVAMRVLGLLVVCAWSAVALANPVATSARASELLEEARAALAEAEDGRDRVRALSRAIRAYEAGLVAASSGLRDLRAEEAMLVQQLEQSRARFSAVAASLQQVNQIPPELRIHHPGGPVAAIRAGVILAALYPQLGEAADRLRSDLDTISTLAALQEASVDDIRAARSELVEARAALETDLASGAAPRIGSDEQRVAADRIGRIARDLSALGDGLSRLPDESLTPTSADLLDRKGTLSLPAEGELMREFGEEDAAGIARKGIVIATRPTALVSAPFPAIVRFTGPFLDHGQVIVLAPDPDRLLVVSGLQRAFVTTGEAVAEGAPLGLMPGGSATTEEFLIELSHGEDAFLSQSLYIELREDGVATNPIPWFTTERADER